MLVVRISRSKWRKWESGVVAVIASDMVLLNGGAGVEGWYIFCAYFLYSNIPKNLSASV